MSNYKYVGNIPIEMPDSSQSKEEQSRIRTSSMALCKQYYESLQDALYTTASYILSYERAIESLYYANIQIQQAIDSLQTIEDDNKKVVEENLAYDIENNNAFSYILDRQKEKLNGLYNNLNKYSEQVIKINRELD